MFLLKHPPLSFASFRIILRVPGVSAQPEVAFFDTIGDHFSAQMAVIREMQFMVGALYHPISGELTASRESCGNAVARV